MEFHADHVIAEMKDPLTMTMPRFLGVVLIFFPLAGFDGGASGEETSRPMGQSFLVVGYLPDYRVEALDSDVGAYVTDLIFFSIEPKTTGELDTTRLTGKALKKLREIRDLHKNRLLVAIGGWGRSRAFANVAADPILRCRFARNLARFCEGNEFNGADFDWEHPANDSENAAYAKLLAEVKAAFRPKRLLVTVALAAWQDPGATAYAAVDRIHIMAYDHEGTRHSTFEQAVNDVKRFETRMVPSAKLCLGLPFYGRGMNDRNVERSYAAIVRKYRPAPQSDEAGGIYFNGIQTIQRKTRYAQEHGLAGVMVWDLGQDTAGKASLLRAIRAASTHR